MTVFQKLVKVYGCLPDLLPGVSGRVGTIEVQDRCVEDEVSSQCPWLVSLNCCHIVGYIQEFFDTLDHGNFVPF